MTRLAASWMTLALICTTFCPASSRGADSFTKGEYERNGKYDEVYRFDVKVLLAAALTKSKDLALKGRDTYFCQYDSSAEPKPCDRMDTVSGQYEDYYQSQMACKQPCPLADMSQSSWTYIAGTKRICRDLATGSCEKAALTLDQVREELINLLQLEGEMDGRPISSRGEQTKPDRSGQ